MAEKLVDGWLETWGERWGESIVIPADAWSELEGLVQQAIKEKDDEIERLRKVIERLGSNEAFDVATAHVSDELKMRMDYASAALSDEGNSSK